MRPIYQDVTIMGSCTPKKVLVGYEPETTFKLLTFAQVSELSLPDQLRYERQARLYLEGKL